MAKCVFGISGLFKSLRRFCLELWVQGCSICIIKTDVYICSIEVNYRSKQRTTPVIADIYDGPYIMIHFFSNNDATIRYLLSLTIQRDMQAD